MRPLLSVCLFVIVFANQSWAEASLQAPLTGLFFDGKAVRPILGIPGATTVGEAIDLGFEPAAARFAYPGQDFGIAIDAQAEKVILLRGVRSGQLTTSVIGKAAGGELFLNSSGNAAVVVSSLNRSFQVIAGLPDNPVFSPVISFETVGRKLTAIDIDVSGQHILAGFSDGASGEVDLMDWTGARSFLSSANLPSAVAYVNGGQDAAIADAGSNQVTLIRQVQGSPEQIVVASGVDLMQPVALKVFHGGHLLIASAGSKTVTDVDLAQLWIAGVYPVPCVPTQLNALNDPNVFLLNEPGSDPAYLFLMSPTPTTVFIPGQDPSRKSILHRPR